MFLGGIEKQHWAERVKRDLSELINFYSSWNQIIKKS